MPGLAIASDIGIAANTIALAVLLHRKRLVTFGLMRWGELAKSFVTAVAATFAGFLVLQFVNVDGSRRADVAALGLVTVVWIAVVAAGLWLTRSDLPRELRRRRAAPPAPEPRSAEVAPTAEP